MSLKLKALPIPDLLLQIGVLDTPPRKPESLINRFNELVEWVDLEGEEAILQAFIETRFDKKHPDDLSNSEMEIVLSGMRKLVVITRARRKGLHD